MPKLQGSDLVSTQLLCHSQSGVTCVGKSVSPPVQFSHQLPERSVQLHEAMSHSGLKSFSSTQ